jgi:anaerobic ribonucleoside-triphosphate reductase
MRKEEILTHLESKRQKCTVYTRVMGYHRPVESFNIGKTGEHRQRVQFKER